MIIFNKWDVLSELECNMLVYDIKDKRGTEKALFAIFLFCRISDFYKE